MIELNCDMGEGQGNDVEIMPLIQRCNIACGGHAGDVRSIRETAMLAIDTDVLVGAHPSYPDRDNFGRRRVVMTSVELLHSLRQQIDRLANELAKLGQAMTHIKPHGALYHDLNTDDGLAAEYCRMMARHYPGVALIGLAAAPLGKKANAHDITYLHEGFMDRRYDDDLHLLPRDHPRGLISDPAQAIEQLRHLSVNQSVVSETGKSHPVRVDTVCVHSDTPGALSLVRAAARWLQERNGGA